MGFTKGKMEQTHESAREETMRIRNALLLCRIERSYWLPPPRNGDNFDRVWEADYHNSSHAEFGDDARSFVWDDEACCVGWL